MTLQSSLQSLVYVKSQASVGTGATITQSDEALRVRSCDFSVVDGTILRDGSQSATGLPAIAVMGGRHWSITMQVELMRFADYTDVDSNPISALLKATGALSAVSYDPGTGSADAINLRFSAAYNPPTAPVPVTVEKHEIGGNRYRATDCFAVITGIAADGQKEILVDLQLVGLWSTPVASTFTAGAADYGASQALQTPTIFTGASLVSGIQNNIGTEQTFTGLQNFGVTPAMQLVARPSVLASAVAGFAPAFLTRTGSSDTVAFSVDLHPEGNTAPDLSVWANWIAQAEGRDLLLISNEGTGGMKLVVAMTEVQYNDPPVSSTAMAFRQYDLVAAGKDPADGSVYGGLDIYFLAGT
jgi:hypothetical protein